MPFTENGIEVTPFDFFVDKLIIVGDYGEIDITYMMVELNIIESLFDKCITGSLVVTDALNVISNLPLLEGDRLKGYIMRNDYDKYIRDFDPDFEIKFEYEVIKIREQKKTKQDQQIWSINFASWSWGDNLGRRVSKSYRQWPYSDMVKDIYDKHLQRGGLSGATEMKGIDVTGTEKLWNIVIPNWKPFQAITYLMRRSFDGDVVNYLFYEDKEKYYFKPLNDLMAEGPKATYFTAVSEEYIGIEESRTISIDVLEPQYNKILSFEMKDYHDISAGAMLGLVNTRLIKHDVFNKRIYDYYYKGPEGDNYIIEDPHEYNKDFAALEHADPGGVEMIKGTTNNKFCWDGDNVLSVYPEHLFQWDDQEQFEPDKWLRQRNGQMQQAKFIRFQIITPGNLTRKVGDKIKIELYSPQWKPKGPDEKPIMDSKFQGNYLITSIRRKFTGDQYSNVLEVIKDDYFSLVNDSIWDRAKTDYPFRKDGKGNVIGL
jgi:hypothetical protein